MPVGLEVRCQKILNEIAITSQSIRGSALVYSTNQNLNVSEKLRQKLEKIRISADTILGAITTASLTDCVIDERLLEWLLGGEPRACLGKLKDMDDMLKLVSQTRPVRVPAQALRPAEDKLTTAIVFFDKHADLFYFLLTPDIWNHKGLFHRSSEELQAFPTTEATGRDPREARLTQRSTATTEDEHGGNVPSSSLGQAVKAKQQKLEEVLRWLAALDCTEKHNTTLKLRQEGTCKWLPSTDAYKEWRTGENHFLWMHGKAGCGKSVLAASTIEHLNTTLREGEVVAFFYCDFQNKRSTDPMEMMRSLLSQLIRHICDLGIDPEELPNRILEKKRNGILTLNDLGKLCDMVARTAICFPVEPFVVIDALDECTDVGPLLDILVNLNQYRDIRLLVTSRSHEDMMSSFNRLPSLSFDTMTKELAADIALHLEQGLRLQNGLRSADAEIKNEIQTKLNEKANGRFRWVQCQLDTLKRCGTKVELKEVLDNLPDGLEATYEKILWAIDERNTEGMLARRTLVWLMVASEPLRLAQIIDGLSVDLELRTITHQREWLQGALLNVLSSLVSYFEETDLLALSHFSVNEYLASSIALPAYHVVSHEAHADVVRMCIRYVSVFLKRKSTRGNDALLESFPMLPYVLSSGFNHIAHVDPQSVVVLEALRSLDLHARSHPSHWDRLCEFREEDLRWPYPPWPSSRHDIVLYLLIAYSSPRLLQSFLSVCHNVKPRFGTNPLVYAADLRRTEHATTLLAYGADVNMPSFVADSSHKASPLMVAIDVGDDALVGELLGRGCVVTTEVLSTAVCMPWCSTRVLAKLMQTDAFVDWTKEIGDEKLLRGIFNSARPNAGDSRQADEDHVALARRLREIGQDLSPDSPFGADLIERAVHAAHMSMLEYILLPDQPPPPRFLLSALTGDTSDTVPVIRFLLRRGADINAASEGRGDTPLHLAAMCPWEPRSLELMQMLINAGCSPHIRNLRGETPLALAMQREYFSVVEYLLSSNGSFTPDSLPTALQLRASPRIIRFLIHKGADVNSSTSSGNTVLHLAVANYVEPCCLDLVKIFIEAGCNLSTHNSEGKTAFRVAMERQYSSVVEHLLSYDFPPPPDSLQIALQYRSASRIVVLLIRKGADVKFTPSDGVTVFHLAITKYIEPESLTLVNKFIEAGYDPTMCNSEGKTVIELAIEHHYTCVVEFLLSYGVPLPPDSLQIALYYRSTPLMIALLVRKGADVNAITSDGNTVLHLVVTNYVEQLCPDLVKIFIQAGCSPAIRNVEGKTALQIAIERHYTFVVERLLSSDLPLPLDILPIALQNHSPPWICELLIDKGADTNVTASDGYTILHLAVMQYIEPRCLDLVKIFFKAGCKPTVSSPDGKTVLGVAVERQYASVMEHLLSYDFPLPLDIVSIALWNRSPPRMVVLLIRKGANVNFTMSNGDTPLHLAIAKYVESECLALVNRLIKAGCNPTICNFEGKTIIQLAIECRYTCVVEFLISYGLPLPPDSLQIALRCFPVPRMVALLIREGAEVNSAMPDGNTLLHLIVNNYVEPLCLDLVKVFIEAGCSPTVRNSEGKTAPQVAIERCYISVVEYFLSCGFPLPPDSILTALQNRFAPQTAAFLIRKGADVNFRTSSGDTALHLAVENYDESASLDLVNMLIEAGCDKTVRNFDDNAVFHVALERRYASVLKRLSRAFPKFIEVDKNLWVYCHSAHDAEAQIRKHRRREVAEGTGGSEAAG